MTTLSIVLFILLALVVVGGIVFALRSHSGDIKAAVNSPPEPRATLTAEEMKLLELYQREWQVVIGTQMHFNDLIIRFRTLTLATFAALVGAALTLTKTANLAPLEMTLLLAIPGVFWVTAWLLDYFYYHRLLLGAVAEAAKFDEAPWFVSLGMFGMTKAIRGHVTPTAAQ